MTKISFHKAVLLMFSALLLAACDGDDSAAGPAGSSDTTGSIGATQRYRPAVAGDAPGFIRCSNWFALEENWPEAARDNDGSTRDWAGVKVVFDHDWLTGIAWFSGSVCERGADG